MFKVQQLWRGNAFEPSLFSPTEEYLVSHTPYGASYKMMRLPSSERKKRAVDNLWLLDCVKSFTDDYGMPQLQPYTGPIDFEPVLYGDRHKSISRHKAIHFFTNDSSIHSWAWKNLLKTTKILVDLNCPVFAPDFSMYVDVPKMINLENLWKNRIVAAFWQLIGLSLVPVGSWGNADSFSYCFNGLPKNSVIAVCGMGHAHRKGAKILWYEAIRELVRQKHPTTIIVYGGDELDEGVFDTPIVHFEDFINGKLRKIRPRKKGLFQPVYPILNLGAGVEDGGEELLLAGGDLQG